MRTIPHLNAWSVWPPLWRSGRARIPDRSPPLQVFVQICDWGVEGVVWNCLLDWEREPWYVWTQFCHLLTQASRNFLIRGKVCWTPVPVKHCNVSPFSCRPWHPSEGINLFGGTLSRAGALISLWLLCPICNRYFVLLILILGFAPQKTFRTLILLLFLASLLWSVNKTSAKL